MPKNQCYRCEGEVEGRLLGIRASICCVECCANFPGRKSNHYHKRLASVTRAAQFYNCTPQDLKCLNYKTAPNPIDPDGRPMRLFLAAEVDSLRQIKYERLKREAIIEAAIEYGEEQVAREQKKDELERALGINLGEMDPLYRAFLLEDYLDKSTGTVTTLKLVIQRFSVLELARSMIDGAKMQGVHPGAILHYLVSAPDGNLSKLLDIQRRCQTVFYTQGDKILNLLDPCDKEKLKGLSLLEEMESSGRSTAASRIHWFIHGDGQDEEYLQILSDRSPHLLRIQRGQKT